MLKLLGLKIFQEESSQIALYTYMAPGFRNLVGKYQRGDPISEKDAMDPPEPKPRPTSPKYRFEKFLYEPKTSKSIERKE